MKKKKLKTKMGWFAKTFMLVNCAALLFGGLGRFIINGEIWGVVLALIGGLGIIAFSAF